MLQIPVKEGESIERALKKYKKNIKLSDCKKKPFASYKLTAESSTILFTAFIIL